MNILFVHYGENWIAGSEVALLELMRAVTKRGVKPFLWCNAPQMQKAAQASGITAWRDEFAYYFDYSSPPFSFARYRQLSGKGAALIAESGAELVHCNSAAPAQWMSLACWRKHVPWIVNLHGRYLKRSRYVLGIHLADAIVAVSAALIQPLLRDGVSPDRIRVVHNGFDEEALLRGDASTLRAELGIPDEAIVGAIAGGLIRLKGHDILFAAMRVLPSSPPFHLLVLGDGPERQTIQAASQGLPVHFLGYRTDLGAILRDSVDFLVVPSRQEAFGRVILDAAFAGIPAIGADTGGIPEAIIDQVTGILVPPENSAALARAISGLIADPSLRKRMGFKAQQRAREEFSIARAAEQMMAIYSEVSARHGRRGLASELGKLKPYGAVLLGGNK
jgi:glycosyltransferase involved in cell wall biosynthesis